MLLAVDVIEIGVAVFKLALAFEAIPSRFIMLRCVRCYRLPLAHFLVHVRVVLLRTQ